MMLELAAATVITLQGFGNVPQGALQGGSYVVRNDPGGITDVYVGKYKSLAGKRIVIDGRCDSACTMALGNPRTCATANASFGFHSAYLVDVASGRRLGPDAAGNRKLMSHYPAGVRAWIARNGGLGPNLKRARGSELGIPPC